MAKKTLMYYLVTRIQDGEYIEEEYNSKEEAVDRCDQLLGLKKSVTMSEVVQKVLFEEDS